RCSTRLVSERDRGGPPAERRQPSLDRCSACADSRCPRRRQAKRLHAAPAANQTKHPRHRGGADARPAKAFASLAAGTTVAPRHLQRRRRGRRKEEGPTMTRKSTMAAPIQAVLLATAAAASAAPPADVCAALELRATGDFANRQFNCHARAMLNG